MSNAVAYNDLTDAERKDREALLRQWGINVTKPSAEVIPVDHPVRKRPPLGLRPVPGDDAHGGDDDNMGEAGRVTLHDGYSFSFKDGVSPEFLDAPATVDLLYDGLNAVTSVADTVHRRAKGLVAEVRSEVARVELENAQLRALVAELRAKVDTLTFISERLRIENAGPIGPVGPMGRDGCEGRPGARGERGERGETGSAAPMIVGWRIDSDRHLVTPQCSDGGSGPPLNLSAFVSNDDDEEG
jgi:hypothetical protein